MKKYHADNFKTTAWSGGTTTELFIWPEGASYAERNFDFRVSTATVEVATSVFTPLVGVNRTLMVLDGGMRLEHEGQHVVNLTPFESDVFDGGWTTRSSGMCSDLNLMCRGNTKGEVHHINVAVQQSFALPAHEGIRLIYIYRGSVFLPDGTVGEPGDLFMFKDAENQEVKGKDTCDFILIDVTLSDDI